MNNSRLIETPRSADLATYTILIAGVELSARYQVKSIVVSNSINRIPFAQLLIFDGDPANQTFSLSNEDLFLPGKEIEIKAGYHNEEESLFKGIVIKHGIKIRESTSILTIECKDPAVKMTVGRKSAFFYDTKDNEVFENLVGKYSDLSAETNDTSITHAELVQYQSSDWDFLVTRAQANGQLCFVENGKIRIAKPNYDQNEIETVAFGATLLDFDAEIDARDQFEKVTAYGWNPTDQELLGIEATDPGTQLNGNLTPQDLQQVIALDNLQLKHGGNLADVELQNWGNAKSLFQQMAKTRGRMKFQGINTVKPDTVIKLKGISDRFNGNVYISGVHHEITEGNWTVDAQFGLDPVWFSETYDISAMPASGIMPAINGLQVGIASSLEDPLGEDRVMVRIPIVDNAQEGIWARMASLDAGENRGAFFRPEIGDEVLVGFINDDPNEPVVLGMLNSSAKPAPIPGSDENHEKGYVSRKGMRLLFDDDKTSVTVDTPRGNSIILNEDDGSLSITDENNNKIVMNADGITIESAKDLMLKATGELSAEGLNVTAKATAQFVAEGGAGAELSTSAIATIKGSLVQIN